MSDREKRRKCSHLFDRRGEATAAHDVNSSLRVYTFPIVCHHRHPLLLPTTCTSVRRIYLYVFDCLHKKRSHFFRLLFTSSTSPILSLYSPPSSSSSSSTPSSRKGRQTQEHFVLLLNCQQCLFSIRTREL